MVIHGELEGEEERKLPNKEADEAFGVRLLADGCGIITGASWMRALRRGNSAYYPV